MISQHGGKMSPVRVFIFIVLLAALISISYVVSGQLFKFGGMVITAFAASDGMPVGDGAAPASADVMLKLVPVFNEPLF
jgi:hypothetical protein